MPKKRSQTQHAEIVRQFAAKLHELRRSRGMTQADLGKAAHITASYIGRLESGGAAPGIDLLERLATALGTTSHELLPLLPQSSTADSLAVLHNRARKLFEALIADADKEMLLMLCPLLARLGESPTRKR